MVEPGQIDVVLDVLYTRRKPSRKGQRSQSWKVPLNLEQHLLNDSIARTRVLFIVRW
jgi:hypothetical protein